MSQPPNKPEHANKKTSVAGAPGFEIERRLMGYAYPANGNVHNPTPRYHWTLYLDGKPVDFASKRGTLLAAAKAPGARKDYSR